MDSNSENNVVSSVDKNEFLENLSEMAENSIEEINYSVESPPDHSVISDYNNYGDSLQSLELFSQKSLVELSKSSWMSTRNYDVQTYLRGCKWSPDGTCCIAVVNNDGIHIFELPRDIYDGDVKQSRSVDILESAIHVKESGTVYDFCWYPKMNSYIPESCCWLTTRQNGPIQLWDAFDGSLRCSYLGYNSVDEMEPAISVTFANDGSQLHAGYKKCIRTFDTDRPGRIYAECKINSPAACLAISKYQENLIAVGSWKTEISLYDIKQDGGIKSMGKMHGHSGGITNIVFHPDGVKLISGARKDSKLLLWDLRHFRKPYRILERVVDTNQRIYFDLSSCGQYLVSGNTNGHLSVWNLNKEIDESDYLKFAFPLHHDCCNGVSMHPIRPIISTTSGQYHNNDPLISSNDSDRIATSPPTELNDSLKYDSLGNLNEQVKDPVPVKSIENSLVFWWTGRWCQDMVL